MSTPKVLARKTVGAGSLWLFAVGASSPMTVLAGGIVATYAGTGVLGVPLSFPLLGVALILLAVGYIAMSRHVPHAAPTYALLAHGLGRGWGPVGAAVALAAYNAIQISLYGLLGVTISGLAGGPWWAWAVLAWVAVGVLGVLHVVVNTSVVAVVLVTEIVVIGLFDLAAFTRPAGDAISFAPMQLDALWVNGVGGVLALGVAAFIGFESGPVYGEEARNSAAPGRATYAAAVFLAVFYALSAWALAVAVGADRVVDVARDPNAGLPFTVLDDAYGAGLSLLATMLLVTSVFAAMLSFHNTVARYVFALGRERVLPAWVARVGTGQRSGGPIGGSLAQSTVAGLALLGFAMAGADPITVLFTWLSAGAAVGVLLLLVAVSIAAIRYFRAGGGTNENVWVRAIVPTAAVIVGTGVVAVTVVNLNSLLGVAPGSPLTWLVPGVVVLTAIIGVVWSWLLRTLRPEVYARIGRGRPHPLAVPEARLADVDV